MKRPTVNTYAALLLKASVNEPDEIPKGAHSRDQWQTIWRLQQAQTLVKLRTLVKRGLMKRKDYRVMEDCGFVRKKPFYWVV